MSDSHEHAVTAQFGPQAAAYVESAVHARGADLDRLAELVRGRSDDRVLDLGCGGGHVAYAIAPHVREVVAVDVSLDMLAAVAEGANARGLANVRTVHAAVEAIAFERASFDLVVSRYSAHHWRHLVPVLEAVRDVLTEAGHAVFIDVVAPADALCDTHLQAVELLRDRSHVRDRSIGEWRRACARAGLRVDHVLEERLYLAFDAWIARMRTPEPAQRAIRDLWATAPAEVRTHFAVDERTADFTVDTATLTCTPT